MSGGTASTVRMNAVQSAGIASGQSQHASNKQNADGLLSVRRRLSTIFQRWMSEKRSPRIQGSSCQSPRAQRYCRAGGRQIVRRRALEQLDVGHEPRAREESLEQIVAEQRVLGHASFERRLERVHVVDALARVRSLGEEILIHVAHRAGVRVHTAWARRSSAGSASRRAPAAAPSRAAAAPHIPPPRGATPDRCAAG